MARWVDDGFGGGHWESNSQYNETNPGKTDANGNQVGLPKPSGIAEGGANNPFWAGDINQYGSLADKYRSEGPVRMDMGQIDQDRALGEQSRNEMLGALNMLAQRAQTGETPATQQLRQQQAQNMASLRGAGLSARGGLAARAAAARTGQMAAGRGQQSNAVGMSALQAAEMDRARQQYMQQATALRAADLQRRGLSAEDAFRQANLSQQSYDLGQRTGLGYEWLRGGTQDYANELRLSAHRRDLGMASENAEKTAQSENATAQGMMGLATATAGAVAQAAGDYYNSQKGKW